MTDGNWLTSLFLRHDASKESAPNGAAKPATAATQEQDVGASESHIAAMISKEVHKQSTSSSSAVH